MQRDISCTDYNEKAIVVRGEETKNCTKELSSLGGKYNSRLKGGPGWIFSKKSEDKVMSYIQNGKVNKEQEIKNNTEDIFSDIKNTIRKMNFKERLSFVNEITKLTITEPYFEKTVNMEQKINIISQQQTTKKVFKPSSDENSDSEDEEVNRPTRRLLK